MLKKYQEECLATLVEFLQDCAENKDIERAYSHATEKHFGQSGIYNDAGFDIPYICLRLPTGGGKTLLASHTIPVVCREFLARDFSLVVWLVPSNAILEQTYNCLQDASHPYRIILEEAFDGHLEVMKVEDALSVSKGTMQSNTLIIISTFASWRVDKTEGRKVYESNGSLVHHFENLDKEKLSALEHFEELDSRNLKYSLANLVYLYNPIFIIDEAHNARTELTFEVLKRLNPSCIVEYTATPKIKGFDRSNVLYNVSAARLKAENMIKMPIELLSGSEWQIIVSDAVTKQRDLEKLSIQEEVLTGEYIRPIVLLQAQNDSEKESTINVEVVKSFLLESCKIPENQIAVATGSIRGIEGIDLLSKACEIRFIITKQALKEGWDCPFAYIFCSVAPVSSNKDAEQLIGRVLRMPRVTAKKTEELNKAYAFVSSPKFTDTLNSLSEYLGNIGFRSEQVSDLIEVSPKQYLIGDYFGYLKVQLTSVPIIENSNHSVFNKIKIDNSDNSIIFLSQISEIEKDELIKTISDNIDKENIEKVYSQLKSAESIKSPSQRGEVFTVPQLFIDFEGESRIFDEEVLIRKDWNLATCDPKFSEQEFPLKTDAGMKGLIDVDGRGDVIAYNANQIREELSNLVLSSTMGKMDLIKWLVSECRHQSITYPQTIVFITNVIEFLQNERHLKIEHLVFTKFRLRSAIRIKILKHFNEAKRDGFNQLLFTDDNIVRETQKLNLGANFSFSKEYPANIYYEGKYRFNKHFHNLVSDMNGEEAECALNIDSHPDVEYWIRNLERTEKFAYWLQTSTDKFYPDFVVKLKDGTIVLVEYKRPDLYDTPDSQEKRKVGEYYEYISNGKCRFVMLKGKEWDKLNRRLKLSVNSGNFT